MNENGPEVSRIYETSKQQAKEHRQQLKIQCLSMANQSGLSATEIVDTAKTFYAFVRT